MGRLEALTSFAIPVTPASEYESDVATTWFELLLGCIRDTPGFSPPVASRAIGYAGVALYEAVLPGMPDYRTLAGSLNDMPAMPAAGRNKAYHWPTVANAALAETLRQLFPTAPPARRDDVVRLEATFAAPIQPGIRDRSVQRGRSVAAAIFDWSRRDGGHEGYLRNFPADYTPPVGPGLWEPTPPGFLRALQPSWGSNRCLLLPSSTDCDPGPPPVYSTDPGSPFLAEALEVYETVNSLSDEQLAIARFWSDDPGLTVTPPGHSASILTQVLQSQHASLELAAEAYARLGIAVADAFVACWRVKFHHNLLRPITYIQATIDPAWGNPLPLITPPFPEYTSGHSVQSGAAATVITGLFGDMPFVDHTHDARGLPARSFASFGAAAEEAALSRLYGGIHFRSAIEKGLAQGGCIGQLATAIPLRG